MNSGAHPSSEGLSSMQRHRCDGLSSLARMPHSRYFGSIAPEADCVEQSITLGEDRVRLDLNILAPTTLAQSEIDRVDATLDELASVDALARAAIASAISDDAQQPAQFWQFHHDEVPGYESLARDEMHAALALKRVGFYPDGAHGVRSFVLLDYAARGPATDQLLVVKLSRDGAVDAIAWES